MKRQLMMIAWSTSTSFAFSFLEFDQVATSMSIVPNEIFHVVGCSQMSQLGQIYSYLYSTDFAKVGYKKGNVIWLDVA